MIRLISILLEEDETEKRTVWRTYSNRFGARNTLNQVRYFKSRDNAAKFARGEIAGPTIGRAIPSKKPQRMKPTQGYDYVPLRPGATTSREVGES